MRNPGRKCFGGFLQPLAGLYRRGPVLRAAEGLLEAGRSRPTLLLEVLRGRVVDAATMAGVDPALATLRNLNRLEDYRRALLDAGFAACDDA